MATERYIHGKKDSCHHDGKFSNVKREMEAKYHEENWQELTDLTPAKPLQQPKQTPQTRPPQDNN